MPSGRRHAEVWSPLYRAGRAAVIGWAKAFNGLAVAGRGNIPDDRGCLVVCNHLADSDGMYLGAALPKPPRIVTHLVTGRHHDGSRIARAVMLRLGLEPVGADGGVVAALRHCRRVLRDGGIVVIYPEGVPGYSARGQRFAEGVGWLALTPGIDVVPAAIWGSQGVARHGVPIGRGPVRVAFGARIPMDGVGDARVQRVREATRRSQARVQRLVVALATVEAARPGAT